MRKQEFAIIGAGLAGCECALTLARYGFRVSLYEQKPESKSEAHASPLFAELVCSNSFRSLEMDSAVGRLKSEMASLGSFTMAQAEKWRVPAGKALAVNRGEFSRALTDLVLADKNITVVNKCVQSLDEVDPAKILVVAAGPMADASLAQSLAATTGESHCYFYDAIAPIVWSESLDHNIVFRGSRYDASDEGDYLNCPFNEVEYDRFHEALLEGKTFAYREFERERHFEGCMPIEALAARGKKTLAFGPLKPVGFVDPRTGKRPFALLQLRPETLNMETCNLVGCQTKLLHPEQERVFRLAPGMEHAEFARYGSMHRNTFVNAPIVLNERMELKKKPGVYLAGQITGVEGYVESAASGLWLAHSLAWRALGKELAPPPPTSALGALLKHLQRPVKNFQPSNVTFGLMPELGEKVKKRDRKAQYARRAMQDFIAWLATIRDSGINLNTGTENE